MIHPILDTTRSIDPAELVPLTDAARTLPICPTTLRKHLRAAGVPLVIYRRRWLVSWRELAAWTAANTQKIANSAQWGQAIHRGRRAARASAPTSTAGGGL